MIVVDAARGRTEGRVGAAGYRTPPGDSHGEDDRSAVRIVSRVQGTIPSPVLRVAYDDQYRGDEKDGDDAQGNRDAACFADSVATGAPAEQDRNQTKNHSRHDEPVREDRREYSHHPKTDGDRRVAGAILVLHCDSIWHDGFLP